MTRKLSLSISPHAVQSISSDEVELLINSAHNGANILLVDVREDNRHGGHIAPESCHSIHIPFSTFNENLLELFNQLMTSQISFVVFYCLYGVEQSPICAEQLNALYTKSQSDMDTEANIKRPQIYYLSGGFSSFINYCSTLNTANQIELLPKREQYLKEWDPQFWVAQSTNRYSPSAKKSELLGHFPKIVYKKSIEQNQIGMPTIGINV